MSGCTLCGDGFFIKSVTVRYGVIRYEEGIGKIRVDLSDILRPPKYCPYCGKRLDRQGKPCEVKAEKEAEK